MKQETSTTQAQGVTIENILNNVDTLVQVAKKGIYKLPIEKRAYVLELISRYLQRASISVHHYKEDMIKRGEADKTTMAQRNSAFHTMYDSIIDN